MSSSLHIALALLLGAAAGLAYCALLWRAVRSLPDARRPGAQVLFGGAIRIALAVLALFLIGGGEWRNLIAALVGFALTRALISGQVLRVSNRPARAPRS